MSEHLLRKHKIPVKYNFDSEGAEDLATDPPLSQRKTPKAQAAVANEMYGTANSTPPQLQYRLVQLQITILHSLEGWQISSYASPFLVRE